MKRKKPSVSPTQRTLKKLKDDGVPAYVTERWNPFARIRQDLFGFIDVVALHDGYILGIQCTSDSSVSARVKKIRESKYFEPWLRAGGRVEVWGWGKKGARGKRKTWTLRTVSMTSAST